MSRMTGPEGTFVISWSQTEIDGLSGAPVSSLETGAVWTWQGEPICIDAATGGGRIWPGETMDTHRLRAAASARRIVARAMVQEGVRMPYKENAAGFDRSFTLTDGHHTWTATLIDMPEFSRPLLMFAAAMPPAGAALRVTEAVATPTLPSRVFEGAEGVVCFTPGTLLETPKGLKPVETLVAGDTVVTKDSGAQPVLWVGSRNVSGARLYAMPDLRPIRIRAGAFGEGRPEEDLVVSPDHRMLLAGQAANDLWGEHEVLVSARDLVDGRGVVRDMAAKSVTYFHLMLEEHHVVVANGFETESFHPAIAALDAIEAEQRKRLFDVMPELGFDTRRYGPLARRALTKAEAALIPHAA